jgi:unsaturated rhamnogalacturonyl hydrolase
MYKWLLAILVFQFQIVNSKTWADSLDAYAREVYLPANKYRWTWQNASLLSVMVKQYDRVAVSERKKYFDYIEQAMHKTYNKARGKSPNSVASGLGMAFLYRITKDEKYKLKCDKIFNEYKQIRRTTEGAVSHLSFTTQLWDDTVFMIGEFLLEMYKATGDEMYLDELVLQTKLHRDKLLNEEWGLWVHGWDSDGKSRCTFCGQWGWPDKATGRSSELWGRGTGWIVVTLSDVLKAIPENNKHRNDLESYLKEMITRLPEWQDKVTGHWYQLPVRNSDNENYIESSCTAMFAYGIATAIDMGIVSDLKYKTSVDAAYNGLRKYSLISYSEKYLKTKNVCKGTCIGDKDYYLNRKTKREKPSGVAMLLNFGLSYKL